MYNFTDFMYVNCIHHSDMAPLLIMFSLSKLLLLLLLLPCSVYAQTTSRTITVNSSITATEKADSWQSPSGDFAFGFQQLEYDDNLFLLSLWYDKIPEKTIVWYPRESEPAPRGSKLELTADRGLLLTGPRGEELWTSNPIVALVSHGVLSDKGNLVLENQKSESLWESFKHPSDTLLPGQVMNPGDELYSRQSETNFSRGRFQLRMQSQGEGGNVQLATLNVPSDYANEPYYVSRATTDSLDSSNNQLAFNESGLFISSRNGDKFALPNGEFVSIPAAAGDLHHRAVLNFDGVLTHLYPLGNEGWVTLSATPENICTSGNVRDGSGVCGYNRICRLGVNQRPTCECPRGFTLVNPDDEYRGCKLDFIEGCRDGETPPVNLYTMRVIENIDWPTSDYELLSRYDEDKCKESCLEDCMCAVAILRDIRCWKKKLPLSNGRENTSVSSKAFIKVRKDNIPPRIPQTTTVRETKNEKGLIVVVSVLLGSSVFINFVLITCVLLGFFFIYHKKLIGRPGRGESVVERTLHCFAYKELTDATNGFKEEIGRGSFGIVYKGVIGIGSVAPTLVAVKKLDRVARDRDKEFKTEVNVIGQTHHKNLVRLIGFCDEGEHRMLVYEFLRNGALASFLFGDSKLTWTQRTQIACSIARGLVYLHEECSTQIIHCDIKPQNILLDDCYDARISDFGLAKLLQIDQTQTNTGIRGTRGYVAAEWFRRMPITAKVDVYSFGVMLLEIVCCRRSVDLEMGEERAILTDWAYDCYREGMVEALVENDEEAMSDMRKVERFVMVSMWCIQEDPSLRPTMKKVLLMLEGILEVPSPPCPCPYSFTS